MFRYLFVILLLLSAPAYAADPFQASGQPIPRYVSLASNKVFVRAGPGLRYPIKWVFQKEGLPVEVIQEFDTWRKVRDMSGDEGWIHQSLLRGKRTVITQGDGYISLLNKPDIEKGREMAKLEPNVIASLEACEGQWCEISADGYAGWTARGNLWGLYPAE